MKPSRTPYTIRTSQKQCIRERKEKKEEIPLERTRDTQGLAGKSKFSCEHCGSVAAVALLHTKHSHDQKGPKKLHMATTGGTLFLGPPSGGGEKTTKGRGGKYRGVKKD